MGHHKMAALREGCVPIGAKLAQLNGAMRTKKKYGVYMNVRLSGANERPLCVKSGRTDTSN